MRRLMRSLLWLVLFSVMCFGAAQADVTTAPNAPTLVSPYNWSVFVGKMPTLCAQENGDPDGDAISAYRFKVEDISSWDSGWITDTCATPAGLQYSTYAWKAQVKDASGETSAWSESWHFTYDSPYVVFTDIHFDPPSPSAAMRVRVHACTKGHAGVGVALRVSVNSATDGSDNGTWHVLDELGVPCFNDMDAPWWNTENYADGRHLFRLQARVNDDTSWDDATTEYRVYKLLPRGVPAQPPLLAPADHARMTNPTIVFRWGAVDDVTGYRLQVAVGDDPTDQPVIDASLPATTTIYTATLPADAATYAWQVIARNDLGKVASAVRTFSVQPLAAENVDTLIIFPQARLQAFYPVQEVANLASSLSLLAGDRGMHGVILDPSTVLTVTTAYTAWDALPTNVAAANAVAQAIKEQVIRPALAEYPNVKALILVGNDAMLPFRRLPDPTRYSDRLYGKVPLRSPIGAAFAAGYFLSDDYYASLQARSVSGHPFYLPDLDIGRLVERPAEMCAQVDRFLDRSESSESALVTGYSFMTDAASLQRQLLLQAGIHPHDLIGENWDASGLLTMLRGTRYALIALNEHASHWSFGAPLGDDRLFTTDLQGADNVAGALVLSPGCQAGLNVPDDLDHPDHPQDWPQTFSAARANFLGNTGFGWGIRGAVGYSERLTSYVVQELLGTNAPTVGDALRRAKWRYRVAAGNMDDIDEKVVQEFTFYGIPQSRPALAKQLTGLHAWPEMPQRVARPQGRTVQTLVFRPELHVATVSGAHDTVPHRYFYTRDREDGLWLKSGWPAQPQQGLWLAGHYLHGVLFVGGVYTSTAHFTPFVPHAENEVVGMDDLNYYRLEAWSPSLLSSFSGPDGDRQAITVREGQYRLGVERLYKEITVNAYLSDSADRTPPWIDDVHSIGNDRAMTVTVRAGDANGVYQVWLTYTEEQAGPVGHWRSLTLTPLGHGIWQRQVPITRPVRYLVQVVDQAGNVTVADNDGAYFRAPAPVGSIGRHCGGVGPISPDYCACVWGIVHQDGEPVAGAQVTLSFNGHSVAGRSGWGAVEAVPYYDLSGQDVGLQVGNRYTLTVGYGGETVIRHVVARPDPNGEQRMDVWLGATDRVWLPVVWK